MLHQYLRREVLAIRPLHPNHNAYQMAKWTISADHHIARIVEESLMVMVCFSWRTSTLKRLLSSFLKEKKSFRRKVFLKSASIEGQYISFRNWAKYERRKTAIKASLICRRLLGTTTYAGLVWWPKVIQNTIDQNRNR